MPNNTVSVIIPCYNQAHFLHEAIESILSQTYRHFEIVVVNDGSTDNTHEVVERYMEIQYVDQKNMGLASARNTGFDRSKGSYLVFLDADDRLLPDALETGLDAFKTHPDCALVYGRYKLIGSDGSPLPTPEQPTVENDYYVRLLRKNLIGVPAMAMYKRSSFDHVGGFRSLADATADYDLYVRIARKFPIYCHAKYVVEYRVHRGNMTNNNVLMLKSSVTVRRSLFKQVTRDREHRAALLTGLRVVQEYYGRRLIDDLKAFKSSKNWNKLCVSLLTLATYYPLGLIHLISPRIYRSLFSQYEGNLDSADCNSIGGWVWEMNRPNTPLEVEIYADNRYLEKILANQFCDELEECGKGNGYHAFRWQLPIELKDGEPHTISVRIAKTNFKLNSTPIEIRCWQS
jgi:glycosyltransferase involved in cell wall biosynthesis